MLIDLQESSANSDDRLFLRGERLRYRRSFFCALVSLTAFAVSMLSIDLALPRSGPDRFETFAIVAVPLAVASAFAAAAVVYSIPLLLQDRWVPALWLLSVSLAAMWVSLRIHWPWLMILRQPFPVFSEKAPDVVLAVLILSAVGWVALLCTALPSSEKQDSAG